MKKGRTDQEHADSPADERQQLAHKEALCEVAPDNLFIGCQ
jgi:hypothetical protein